MSGARQGDRDLPYDALGYRFRFCSADESLRRFVDALFAGLAGTSRAASARYTHTIDEGGHRLWCDGALVGQPGPPGHVLPTLLWHVNDQAVAAAADRVVVHAGVVAHDGRGLLLAGPSGAGKTTLTTALVQAGCAYLSDEMAVVDAATRRLHPFAKPLSLKPGSWRLFPELAPSGAAIAPYVSWQWQVPANSIRAHVPPRAAVPQVIVVLERSADGAGTLQPLGRAEAVLALADNLLTFGTPPRRGFEALAAVVRQARCFRLTAGRLEHAVQLLTAVLAEEMEESA